MHKAQGQDIVTQNNINGNNINTVQHGTKRDTLTPEQKERAAIDTLIKTKFSLSFSMIDSVYKRLENTLTVTDYNRNIQAFNFFVQMMIQTWLEDYRRRKQK